MSYIVYGGPLFWPVITTAAVLAALLGRFTYRHWHHGPMLPAEWASGHGRHAAPKAPGAGDAGDSRAPDKTPGGSVAPPPTAPAGPPWSDREDGLTAAELASWREMNGPYPGEPTEDMGSPEDWPGTYGVRYEEDNRRPGQIQQRIFEPQGDPLDTAEMRAIRLRELAAPCEKCRIDHVGNCCTLCGFDYGTCDCAEYCGQLSCMTGVADMTYIPAPMTRQPEPPPASNWYAPRVVPDAPPAVPWDPACGICDSPGHDTRGHDLATATARQADAATRQANVLLAGVMLWARTQQDRPAPALTLGSLDHVERRLWTTETGSFAAICGTDGSTLGGGNG